MINFFKLFVCKSNKKKHSENSERCRNAFFIIRKCEIYSIGIPIKPPDFKNQNCKIPKRMKTKLLMIASALIMGLFSIIATFLPNEILLALGQIPTTTFILLIQITGALYFGFAIMNWMAKTVLIGGIYARPLAMGNFSHFMIVSLALIKFLISHSVTPYLWVVAILYSLFAILFGKVLFTSPIKSS